MKQLIYQPTLFEIKPIGITDGEMKLVECTSQEADGVIKLYHYSKKSTPNRFKSFSVNDGMGYLQLGYGIRPHMKHTIHGGITKDNYCEFDRMWLSDKLPKNSESRVIGLLLSYLKQVYPKIKFVITYADGSVGNKGIIYKASNAFYIGKINVDFYILETGERVHPVSMYHRHKTRAWGYLQSVYPNIKHIRDEYQYRYLYILNKGMRRKYQERYDLLPANKVGGGSQTSHQKKLREIKHQLR